MIQISNEVNIKWYMSVHETTTMLFLLLSLSNVLNMYSELSHTYGVSKKFEYFVSFLRQNCIINKSDAANTLYNIYDKNSIIECELIVYGLDYIVHTALHMINKCMLKYIFFSK